MAGIFQGRKRGSEAERQAQQFLEQQGLKTVTCNYHCKMGEIDIIMQERQTLVFVEVRYRKRRSFGSASESVTRSKRQKLIRAAQHYLSRHNQHHRPCRFDVLAINGQTDQSIEWIPDAFQQELV